MFVDYARWNEPIYSYQSADHVTLEAFARDGIHRIQLGDGPLTLDVFARGLTRFSPTDQCPLLVVFNAALSAAKRKEGLLAPIFSGRRMAEHLGVPLLAFSDPTLALSREILLAWHSGTDKTGDVARLTSEILDRISSDSSCGRLFLLGGSGGGFAALNVARRMKTPATIVVHNPQIALSRYTQSFCRKYLEIAFPSSKVKASEKLEADALESLMSVHCAGHSVDVGSHKAFPKWHRLVYLQNCSDSLHMKEHAGRFFAGSTFKEVGRGTFRIGTTENVFFVGDWGKGHSAMPASIFSEVVRPLVAGASTQEICGTLSGWRGLRLKRDTVFFGSEFGDVGKVAVQVRQLDGKAELVAQLRRTDIKGNAAIDPRYHQFAFYVLHGGRRLAARWYEHADHWLIPLDGLPDQFVVKAFARDPFGQKSIGQRQINISGWRQESDNARVVTAARSTRQVVSQFDPVAVQ